MSDIINMISNAEYLKENDNNIFEELYVIQNISIVPKMNNGGM